MTREEAIGALVAARLVLDFNGVDAPEYTEAMNMAISALRPVTREQAEKMRGEWIIEDVGNGDRRKKCSLCNQSISGWWGRDRFCANCGSPMTDEAVDMVMERMEEMSREDN